jgi:DnaK suppressor protein
MAEKKKKTGGKAGTAASKKKSPPGKKPALKSGEVSKPVKAVRKTAAPKPSSGKKAVKKTGTEKNGLQDLRKSLLKRREAIVSEAKDEISKYISGENRQLVDTALDDGDWAVVDISEDVNLRRLSAHRKLLLDIDETLRKIDEGTYGTCEECGEPISEKRLQVMPTATLCISCKENKEQLEAIESAE